MYYSYILRSCKDNTFYYGSTQELDSRIKAHNSGKVKYTKGHRPYVLYYYEKFDSRKEAMKRKIFQIYFWLYLVNTKQNNLKLI